MNQPTRPLAGMNPEYPERPANAVYEDFARVKPGQMVRIHLFPSHKQENGTELVRAVHRALSEVTHQKLEVFGKEGVFVAVIEVPKGTETNATREPSVFYSFEPCPWVADLPCKICGIKPKEGPETPQKRKNENRRKNKRKRRREGKKKK